MKTYDFTIIASGLDPQAEDFAERFYKAGCDDSTISFQKGLIILEFDREAKSFAHALISAFAAVNTAGAKVERFEPDHLVSLSDIAARSGMSRAAISLYCKGERKDGFPLPVARVTSESPLWDWVDVARWMHKYAMLSQEAVLAARLVREANVMTQTKSIPHEQFAKKLEKLAAA